MIVNLSRGAAHLDAFCHLAGIMGACDRMFRKGFAIKRAVIYTQTNTGANDVAMHQVCACFLNVTYIL